MSDPTSIWCTVCGAAAGFPCTNTKGKRLGHSHRLRREQAASIPATAEPKQPNGRRIIGGPVQIHNADYTESCPKCGAKLEEEDRGFGLAYGGFGNYITCSNPDCDWFIKECLADDEC